MPRIARVVVPHCPHHVTQRGNRRQQTFFGDADYRYYLHLMAKFCAKAGTQVWAYCLMPNHVHLVMVPTKEDGLRGAIGEAHRRYTRFINARENWRGHLWQERFRSFPMHERHLYAAVRYIECNPVAAGLCEQPEQWKWSSARAHLSKCDDILVKTQPMLGRVENWRAYLTQNNHNHEIVTIEKHLHTGRPLGDEQFLSAIELQLGRSIRCHKRGRKPGYGKKYTVPN